MIKSDFNMNNVVIYDITGKFIKGFNDERTYSINDIESGMYLLEVQTDEKTYTTKLFVK